MVLACDTGAAGNHCLRIVLINGTCPEDSQKGAFQAYLVLLARPSACCILGDQVIYAGARGTLHECGTTGLVPRVQSCQSMHPKDGHELSCVCMITAWIHLTFPAKHLGSTV